MPFDVSVCTFGNMKLKIILLPFVLTLLFEFAFSNVRIFGGCRVNITNAPYMAHITRFSDRSNPDGRIHEKLHLCGGSILKPNLILTAAHCAKDKTTGEIYKPDRFDIRVGSNSAVSGGVTHSVKNVYPHPKYIGSDHHHNDVALLELVDNIVLNDKTKLVNLAYNHDRPAVGTDGVVSGWGKNPDHLNDSLKVLYQVHLKVISAESCYEQFEIDSVKEIDKHQICAQAPGKNFCSGDSGGPFIDTTTNRQIGIVSFGADCTTDTPSVFCRVTDNLDFIKHIIRRTGN